MEEKWAELERRYEELEKRLGELQMARDVPELRRVAKMKARLEKPVALYREWLHLGREIEEAHTLLAEESDAELAEELAAFQRRRAAVEEELTFALLPRDENDEKDVIIEIRAGTGGDEASLFAGDLLRMYSRYADSRNWKVEMISASEGEVGGFKEVIASVKGNEAYSHFKHESGVHRVQRVPQTESGGRIHTSTATVAVLPEAEEVDVTINPEDLEIETFRASGPGGQHMQKNETAVRITHRPSGIVVASQSQRSQGQNKVQAMRILRARIFEKVRMEAQAEVDAQRRQMVGSGERGEKIRTYNFLQDRITDHRLKKDWHGIAAILDGDLSEILEAMREKEREALLRKVADEAAR
jgi:peptide chain release factor 1